MLNLAAAPVLSGTLALSVTLALSGTLAEDWLDVGVGAILGVEAVLIVALADALAVSLTDSTVICPVLALLVKVATEVDWALVLVVVALALGAVLVAVLSKLFPATTSTVKNLTSSLEKTAVTGSPPVSSLPPSCFTVHVISTFFLL